MNDRDFMRYSRQILLEDIAIDGQQKLLASRVLIVGLGGLGAPAALYLAGAGVGTLVLADDDEVHLSNLQRQILFTTEDINQPKAQITRQRLNQLNPDIALIALQERLSGDNLSRDAPGDQRRLRGKSYAAYHRQRGGVRRADDGPDPAVDAGLLSLPVAGRCRADAQLPYRGHSWSGGRRDGHHAGAGGHQAAQRHGDGTQYATAI
jgi:hypothetical protein